MGVDIVGEEREKRGKGEGVSAAGVSAGGRTGLANMVTAILLLAALSLYPLARLMGGGLPGPNGGTLYSVTPTPFQPS
jgi:hypothetical protein